jgi:anaphase-promoting complex subunit 2
MSVYEQYIMGMLTNFEAGLPLDRIHNMLKMFVPDQAYDKNIDQLSGFLGQLVADEKLFNSGNVYTKQA